LNQNHGLKIVLVEPEIPQNTGTIGRLCLAVNAELHLVHPLGFEITESRLKRAGLDYWEHLHVTHHESIDEFLKNKDPSFDLFLLTKKAGSTIFEQKITSGSYLLFGKETAGLPEWLIHQYPTGATRIPMFDARVRSLNLANAASVVLYEGIRQLSL
tara:strand:- start:959 stop:1429 length:471 start_codon:yes stop_codon:yes gene_type:complete